jgi:hypothetical protein
MIVRLRFRGYFTRLDSQARHCRHSFLNTGQGYLTFIA